MSVGGVCHAATLRRQRLLCNNFLLLHLHARVWAGVDEDVDSGGEALVLWLIRVPIGRGMTHSDPRRFKRYLAAFGHFTAQQREVSGEDGEVFNRWFLPAYRPLKDGLHHRLHARAVDEDSALLGSEDAQSVDVNPDLAEFPQRRG